MIRRFRGRAVVWFLLAGAPASGYGQTGTRVGPIAGVNIANFGGDVEDLGSRTSFLAGGFANFWLSRHLALEPELLYTQKGAETVVENVTGTIKLSYLQLPLLAQIRFPTKDLTPYLLFGPAFAFKLDCTAEVSSGTFEVSADCDQTDFSIKDTDLSLIGGIGLEIKDFSASVRYDYGLSGLLDTELVDVYNRTFLFTVGYGFRIRQ